MIGLSGGQWVAVVNVQRWIPAAALVDGDTVRQATPAPRRRPVDVHTLVACPTCLARADERCKSTGGHPVDNHVARVISVRCPCGRSVAPKMRYCSDGCRAQARKITYRQREICVPTAKRRASR